MISLVPVLNKSRGPARHFAELTLIISVMSALGLQGLCQLSGLARKKAIISIVSIFSLLLLGPWIWIQFHPELSHIFKSQSTLSILSNSFIKTQLMVLTGVFISLLGILFLNSPKYALYMVLILSFTDGYLNRQFTDWSRNHSPDPVSKGYDSDQKHLASLLPKEARYYFHLAITGNDADYYLKGMLPFLFFRPYISALSSRETIDQYSPLALSDTARIMVASWIKPEILDIYGIDYTGGIYRTIQKPDILEHLPVGKCTATTSGISQFLKTKDQIDFRLPEGNFLENNSSDLPVQIQVYTSALCGANAQNEKNLSIRFFNNGKSLKSNSHLSNQKCLNQVSDSLSALAGQGCLVMAFQFNTAQKITNISIRPASGLMYRIEAISMKTKSGPEIYYSPRQLMPNDQNSKTIFKNSLFVARQRKTLGLAFLSSAVYQVQPSSAMLLLMMGDSDKAPSDYKTVYRHIKSGSVALVEMGSSQKYTLKKSLHWNNDVILEKPGTLKLIQRKNRKIKWESFSDHESFLVINQSWYPGWKAYVNKKKTPLYKTNFLATGLYLPSGKNSIELIFEPTKLWIGTIISIVGILILLVITTLTIKKDIRFKNATTFIQNNLYNNDSKILAWPLLIYGATGIISTLVHFLILTLLTEYFTINPVISTGPSFIVAVIASYLLNSSLVFKQPVKSSRRLFRFFLVAAFGLILNVVLMYILVQILSLWYIIAFVLISGFVAFCTYLLNHFWTFGIASQ